MARLLIKCSGVPARSVELQLGTNRLGRSEANDFSIDDPTVSGNHCEILLADDSLMIRDLGSTNGTLINGRAVHETRLEAGQIIQLGVVELVVDSTEVEVAIPHPEEPPLAWPALLADGSRACVNHPQAQAMHRCVQCHKMFCDLCVHELHRVGGKPLRLCPACSGPCESTQVPIEATPVKKTFMDQLRKTLKISHKGDTEVAAKGERVE